MPTVTPQNLFGPAPDRGDGALSAAESEAPARALPSGRERDAGMMPPDMAREEAPQYPATPARKGATEPKTSPPKASALLSAKEKQALGMISRTCYDKLVDMGVLDEDEISLTDWRHQEVSRATKGKASRLGDAESWQFRQIRGHFRNLMGDGGGAFQDSTRDQGGRADWELAYHKLEGACKQWEVVWPGYPLAICRNQYRCELRDATAKQLWALFYTITNRGRAKRKEAARKAALGIDN